MKNEKHEIEKMRSFHRNFLDDSPKMIPCVETNLEPCQILKIEFFCEHSQHFNAQLPKIIGHTLKIFWNVMH